MEQAMSEPKPREAIILRQLMQTSSTMTGWLKFLGIINIISGALTALSLWGIIIAWLPIWLGILLLQASQRITTARFANDGGELVGMMEKLRLYFIIQGVLIIVSFAVGIIALVVFGGLIFQMMQSGGFETF